MSHLRIFIERVLTKRQALKPKLEAVQSALRELGVHLDQLQRLATEAGTNADTPADLLPRLSLLEGSIVKLQTQINDANGHTANLVARFGKKTIDIGVAGKARQGKSTILQAISGLDNQVIPAADGLPCTGAKSRIVHDPADSYAEIEFFTPAEFLREIIHAYYEELQFRDLPASLDEFARNLPSKPSFEKPEEFAVYEKLRELHQGIGSYRAYLSNAPKRIGLEEVRDYVSQEDGRKRYIAVKCANIHVPFPNADVTGLAIIDLPGLGEIAKGHSEKLVSSLQREVDAIVLVKLPAADGDDWFATDIKVFNEVKRAVPELDLADWLFVVLNRKDNGSNDKVVEILKNRALHIGSSPRIVDVICKDPQAVQDRVFMEVLRHLEENLERIDQRQLTLLGERLTHIGKDVATAVQPIQEYFQKDSIGTGDFETFGKRFRTFWQELTGNLENITAEYRRMVYDKFMAKRFRAAVDEACDAAESRVSILPVADLKGLFNASGGWEGVVLDELHHLRAMLTHCLADILDRRLAEMVDEVKHQIMGQILADPVGRILPSAMREDTNPSHRLAAFQQLLEASNQPTLIAGIHYLFSFSFSYQSHFHHRVREAMDALDPMARREQGDDNPVEVICPRANEARFAEDVGRGLRVHYEKVVFRVRKRLHQEMENDPMRAIFSMVEETRDRLVRARESREEWERLLYPRRAEIWPKDFNRFAVASALRQEWQTRLETLLRCASSIRSVMG